MVSVSTVWYPHPVAGQSEIGVSRRHLDPLRSLQAVYEPLRSTLEAVYDFSGYWSESVGSGVMLASSMMTGKK